MLLRDDADLIRRDSVLPGLALLLDPEALAGLVTRSLTDAEIGGVQINYVRYKPGMSCLVGYRFQIGDINVAAYAKTYRTEEVGKLRHAPGENTAASPSGLGYFVWPDKAIALCVFPHDSELCGLGELADDEPAKSLWRKLFPEHPALWDSTLATLSYKPERRYVGKLSTAAGPQAAVRFYTASGYQSARVHAKYFHSRAPLRVARRLGRSARHQVLAFEWLPGRLLSEALRAPGFDAQTLRSVGAALATLHSQQPKDLAQLSRDAEAQGLLELAEAVGWLCPHLAARAEQLARNLADQLSREPSLTCSIHGDFYAKQVLLDSEEVAIIDLDRAARGDPAADLGNFIAHLERDALHETITSTRVLELQEALFEGYGEAAAAPAPARSALYIASSLFRLTLDPFRNRDPNWVARTEAMIARVETMREDARRCVPVAGSARTTTAPATVPVRDPFDIATDPQMTFLARALDPGWMQRHFPNQLRTISVTRYKRGRRCLIEYELENGRTVIGKVRARGLDHATFRVLKSLCQGGFGPAAEDGVQVPQPIGLIPELQMLLQEKAPGKLARVVLTGPDGVALSRRIGFAINKLHQAGVSTHRAHPMARELSILHERLAQVIEQHPEWETRMRRVLDACDRLGAATPIPRACGIHRDFYADHVLVDGPRLYLLDFDMYTLGDPGLDVGNFIGHLTEQALREFGDATALADREEALVERFVELAGVATRAAVRAYATLTLARHIYLSTRFADRRAFTERLLELCEQRLGLAAMGVR